MYGFLHSNNLISDNQSGFRPGDSTINQLLSITHDIYVSFENISETLFLRLLIRSGMKASFSSFVVVELMVIFFVS